MIVPFSRFSQTTTPTRLGIYDMGQSLESDVKTSNLSYILINLACPLV